MASELKVDTIVNSAGSSGPSLPNTTTIKISNTSTYVSEGGAKTQNTVQGLAKAYGSVNQDSTQNLVGGFNMSGVTDTGTGTTTKSFTNNMSDQTYSIVGSANTNSNYFQHQHYSINTGSIGVYNSPDYNLNNDDGIPSTGILGDLA